MAYLFWAIDLSETDPASEGLTSGPVCSLGCLKPSVPAVSRFANRATFSSRVRLRTQFVVGVGTGRTLTGAGVSLFDRQSSRLGVAVLHRGVVRLLDDDEAPLVL